MPTLSAVGKRSVGDRVFDVINYVIIILLTLIFLFPFLTVIGTSFLSQQEVIERGFVLIPRKWDTNSYKLLLQEGSSLRGAYVITIFRTVVGSALQVLITAMTAYPLSKKDLPGRVGILKFLFVTMIISGGLIPTYLVVETLGLTNTIWALIVPSLMSVFNVLLMRNYFYTIPVSLEESAVLDGASPLVILTRIMIPLAKPIIATVTLFAAVAHWNSWFDAAIYVNEDLYPVQNILRRYVLAGQVSDINMMMVGGEAGAPPSIAIKSTAIVITTLPILVIYPFVQKYFVSGIMVGSVKG